MRCLISWLLVKYLTAVETSLVASIARHYKVRAHTFSIPSAGSRDCATHRWKQVFRHRWIYKYGRSTKISLASSRQSRSCKSKLCVMGVLQCDGPKYRSHPCGLGSNSPLSDVDCYSGILQCQSVSTATRRQGVHTVSAHFWQFVWQMIGACVCTYTCVDCSCTVERLIN